MMRPGSLPARRRFELIRLAQRQGQLSVAELSAQFGVSADTIRRDLDLLSVGGFVRRTHGGAVPADYLVQGGSSSAQRNGSRIAEKTRIAQCASELIEDRESVILNGGSTTRLFAFELGGKKDLTVVANSLGIYRPHFHARRFAISSCSAANTGRSLISPWVQSLSAERSQSAPIAPYSVAPGITQDGIFAELLQDATMTAA
jgi:DeoR/GlpR family transcriptional regulator of sugar metabolism